MGKLRRSTPFGQRSDVSQSIEPGRIFVIATEGNLTEKLYFEGFNERTRQLDINNNDKVIVKVLDRSHTKSAPKYVKELLDGYKDDGVQPKELWMVIDRDPQNTAKKNLIAIIKACHNDHYNIALTNPCFEFWLLLHVVDITQYKPEELLKNIKVNTKRRFLDKELSRQLRGYNKNRLKFEKFEPHLDKAITQAALFAVDVYEIMDALGTNIHILVKSILRI
jgi:hypothetical protein